MTTFLLTTLRRRTSLGLLRRMTKALSLRRQRSRLAQLDDHLLQDIGVTRQQAVVEAALPLWSAPRHWRS